MHNVGLSLWATREMAIMPIKTKSILHSLGVSLYLSLYSYSPIVINRSSFVCVAVSCNCNSIYMCTYVYFMTF